MIGWETMNETWNDDAGGRRGGGHHGRVELRRRSERGWRMEVGVGVCVSVFCLLL